MSKTSETAGHSKTSGEAKPTTEVPNDNGAGRLHAEFGMAAVLAAGILFI
jgi:hypothetical protein